MITYAVVKLDARSIAGDELWTVAQYADGVCTGGDHHWVRERYAVRARFIYERGYHASHGHSTSTDLGNLWRLLNGAEAEMFDEDPT